MPQCYCPVLRVVEAGTDSAPNHLGKLGTTGGSLGHSTTMRTQLDLLFKEHDVCLSRIQHQQICIRRPLVAMRVSPRKFLVGGDPPRSREHLTCLCQIRMRAMPWRKTRPPLLPSGGFGLRSVIVIAFESHCHAECGGSSSRQGCSDRLH